MNKKVDPIKSWQRVAGNIIGALIIAVIIILFLLIAAGLIQRAWQFAIGA